MSVLEISSNGIWKHSTINLIRTTNFQICQKFCSAKIEFFLPSSKAKAYHIYVEEKNSVTRLNYSAGQCVLASDLNCSKGENDIDIKLTHQRSQQAHFWSVHVLVCLVLFASFYLVSMIVNIFVLRASIDELYWTFEPRIRLTCMTKRRIVYWTASRWHKIKKLISDWFGAQGDEQWNTIHRWFLAICRFESSPFISFSF